MVFFISRWGWRNADDQGNGHVDGGNAQNLQTVLGKVVRIDVDGRNSANGKYGIPNDNPFLDGSGLPRFMLMVCGIPTATVSID